MTAGVSLAVPLSRAVGVCIGMIPAGHFYGSYIVTHRERAGACKARRTGSAAQSLVWCWKPRGRREGRGGEMLPSRIL
jgi:hypothetical protein